MNYLYLLPILFPAVAALLIYLLPESRLKSGKALFMTATLINSALMLFLVIFPQEKLVLFDYGKDLGVSLSLSFCLDGPGRFFASLVSLLWPFALLYAFGYMENTEKQPVFYLFYTVSFGMTCGVALSANLLTLYVFYEMLTLSTIPLVLHGYTQAHRRAALRYTAYTLGGAAFGFMGLGFILYLTGSTEFVYGGLFSGEPTALIQTVFLVCFFGFGVKAAIFPLSHWLPAASVAATPVTALLHAVAVVKAGAFSLIRLVYYIFGADFLKNTVSSRVAMAFALFTVVYGSAMALQSGHVKRRLAWSTVANLSYIASAVMLCSEAGMYAALFHTAAHAVTKMCSFLCAGNYMHCTGKERIEDINGIGKKMPVTFVCFTLASLSLIGIPPFFGFFSKWRLLIAAAEENGVFGYLMIAALLISAILTAIYTFTIVMRAFFPAQGKDLNTLSDGKKFQTSEANVKMLLPVCIFAFAALLCGIFSNQLFDVISGL